MFERILDFINWALGTGQCEFNFFHMSVRGLVVYFFGFIVMRLDKQIMGIRTPFNLVLNVILGAILANAITFHEIDFFAVMGMATVLVLVNKATIHFAYYFRSLEKFVKGSPILLVENGKIKWEVMRHNAITEEDLLSAMRQDAGLHDISKIDKAFLENGGFISFILKEKLN